MIFCFNFIMIILSHQIKTLIRFGASKIQSSNILFHAKKLSIELIETNFFFFLVHGWTRTPYLSLMAICSGPRSNFLALSP